MPSVLRQSMLRIAGLVLLLAGCAGETDEPSGRSGPSMRPPARVEAVRVMPVAYRPLRERSCRFRARDRARLRNLEAGTVLEVGVEVGDRVTRGQPLVRLDDRELRAELDQARVRVRQARHDLERLERLEDSRLVTEEARQQARTDLELALAEERRLTLRLERMRIVAPFGGLVRERLVEPGETVAAQTDLLTLVSEALTVESDMPAGWRPADLHEAAFEVRPDWAPETSWTAAEPTHIAPGADPVTGLVPIEVRPRRPVAGALDGAPCRLRWRSPPRRGLLIPIDALRHDASGEYVYRIVDGRARRTEVRSGEPVDDRIEILAGLQAGDTIVVRGFLGLRDGRRVNTGTGS